MKNNIRNQIKSLMPIWLELYIPAFIVLIVAAVQNYIPIPYLTRDPAAVANLPPYVGFFSNIGVLFWCITATICIFSYFLIKGNVPAAPRASFFLYSGLITAMLMLDDLFLGHEYIFKELFGISEKIVYLGYFIVFVVYLYKFKDDILKSEYLAFGVAFGFLGLSVFLDRLPERFLPEALLAANYNFIIEDGFKLLGIIGWFVYFTRTSILRVRKSLI